MYISAGIFVIWGILLILFILNLLYKCNGYLLNAILIGGLVANVGSCIAIQKISGVLVELSELSFTDFNSCVDQYTQIDEKQITKQIFEQRLG